MQGLGLHLVTSLTPSSPSSLSRAHRRQSGQQIADDDAPPAGSLSTAYTTPHQLTGAPDSQATCELSYGLDSSGCSKAGPLSRRRATTLAVLCGCTVLCIMSCWGLRLVLPTVVSSPSVPSTSTAPRDNAHGLGLWFLDPGGSHGNVYDVDALCHNGAQRPMTPRRLHLPHG